MFAIFNGDVKDSFNLNTVEANAAQNGISRELLLLKEPSATPFEKVALYWDQAKNDPEAKVGDKAIIESITHAPVKTIFDPPGIKGAMLFDVEENPFDYAYVVDVIVDTIKDKPALYKIIKYHEKFKPNV